MIKAGDLDFLTELARARAGLEMRGDAAYLAETRLDPVARREGAASAADLVSRARNGGDPRLLDALVEALTVQDTAFFRDKAVFELLVDQVLPELARTRPGRVVRVWFAGCGTGQEVYSLALLAAERAAADVAAAAGVKLQLFASDLSARALQKARSGLYSHFEVQRGLPIRMLLRDFTKADDLWRVEAHLRSQVRWARINLMDDLARLGEFDVVLCRNVLGQFHAQAAAVALAALAERVAPDGRLILGAGEPAALAGWEGAEGVYGRAREVARAA